MKRNRMGARHKLTLVSVNDRSRFLWLPVDSQGRARISMAEVYATFGIQPNECVYFGYHRWRTR